LLVAAEAVLATVQLALAVAVAVLADTAQVYLES
jgi:hypothetical protein